MGHVLIVEHDPFVRNLINNLCAAKNYTADQAVNRHEAVAMLRAQRYELILIDLMLPEDNGLLVLEYLQATFPDQTEHTVVMTAADPKFIRRLPPVGWCAVLIKPFAISEFNRVIDLCGGGTHAAGKAF
jgi:CheY-like chemotaxis protein